MCTRPKLVNIGVFNAINKGYTRPTLPCYNSYRFVPCGMCIECRNMRREEYTQRLKHEIQTANYIASFITLTYRDDTLPLLYPLNSAAVGTYFGGIPPAYGSTLYKPDAKKFCDNLTKRFRRKYGKRPFKYICAGEYGDDGHRPHLHLIIVGLPASERKMVYECWNKGKIDISPVGNGAIRYVLSYIDKQVFGANDLYNAYGDFQPPFCLFSKGIGKDWIEKNLNKFDRFGKIEFGASGKSYTLNPYYRRKYDFDTKVYNTPFSDSVIEWAKAKHMSLSEAYIDRCKLKQIELEHKQIKDRQPLYRASKAIIKKELSQLGNKKNLTEEDYQDFTKRILQPDEYLVFKENFLNEYRQNLKEIKHFKDWQNSN